MNPTEPTPVVVQIIGWLFFPFWGTAMVLVAAGFVYFFYRLWQFFLLTLGAIAGPTRRIRDWCGGRLGIR